MGERYSHYKGTLTLEAGDFKGILVAVQVGSTTPQGIGQKVKERD